MDFHAFCVFLCFKARCIELQSSRVFAFLSGSQVFFTCLLKHGNFRFPRRNCSYRSSKSRRYTDVSGWKRIATFPPTSILFFSFRSLLLPLFDKYGLDAMVTVWLTWKKNPKFWNVLDNTGRVLTETAESRQTESFQSNSQPWLFFQSTITLWTRECGKQLNTLHTIN